MKIQNNVSVYDNVTLESDVFCGPSMVFTNVYNPRAAISRKDEYRDTLVKRGATLGANCTIVCGVVIGEHAFVGAGAVINRDVPAVCLDGRRAGRQIGWMSRFGERLQLPLERRCGSDLSGHGRALSTARRCMHVARNWHMQAWRANEGWWLVVHEGHELVIGRASSTRSCTDRPAPPHLIRVSPEISTCSS